MCDILSWLTRLPNVVWWEPPGRSAVSGCSIARRLPSRNILDDAQEPLLALGTATSGDKADIVKGRVQAALDLRAKTESSTPTPRDPSLSLQARSVPGLEERGRIAGGIELERCPVRVRSREKHPVRGSRQSADSRQVTRDDAIQKDKEGNWGEAYVGAIFPVCRLHGGCWVVEFAKDQEGKFAWWAREKAPSARRRVGPWDGGT